MGEGDNGEWERVVVGKWRGKALCKILTTKYKIKTTNVYGFHRNFAPSKSTLINKPETNDG